VLGAGVLALLALWTAGRAAAAPSEDWPPISNAELAMKDCPGQPGAPAAYLYREQTSDDNEWTFKAFFRLKILTPAGKDYGNIEIPISEVWRVKDIKARVVRPGGESRDFTGEIFEKTVLRTGRFEMLVKTFALPDIDVGSIIDYRYELKLDLKKALSIGSQRLIRWKPEEGGISDDTPILSWPVEIWEIPAPLYTYKAKYVYIPFQKGQLSFSGQSMRLAWVSHGLTWGPPEMRNNRVELEIDHIPAWETEEFMAPEEAGQMGVQFFFCDNRILDAAEYWKSESANWQNGAENFMSKAGDIATESRILISQAAAPLDKLEALYERAQRIRNWSYDKTMTYARRREQKVKDNRNVADVLRRHSGLRSDITRTFVALARAAGFRADVARVVTRDDKFFHENLLGLYWQFDSEVAIVEIDGREMFFDPATPFCPMGLVRWNCTDTTFIRTSGPAGRFNTTPPDPPEKTQIRRELALQLNLQGNLNGTAKVSFTGQEALALRLDHFGSDDIEVKKDLEAEMTATLPGGAKATLRKVENFNNSADDIKAEFDIAVPGAATLVGDRMLLPASPSRVGRKYSFPHARRQYSIYFPYAFREYDDIVVTLPAGVKAEGIPAVIQNKRSFSEYSLTCAVEDGTKLHVRRELVIGKSRIPADQYSILKIFFDQVRAGDEGQVVLELEKK
jgi:hypothetical protein